MSYELRRVYLSVKSLRTDPSRRGLVSIGLHDDAGQSYYAVNADMDSYRAYTQTERHGTFWTRDHVWRHLPTLDRPDRLDYSHPDVKPFDQIRDEVAGYFTTDREPHIYAYEGDSDMTRLWSLWNNDRLSTPVTVPTWHWDLRAEQYRAGEPELPPHPGRPHHALDDARHNRIIHEHLLHAMAGASR
ncbi:hypothetical protein ACUXZZ_45055 (plasmid) [Streptomyces graminifolii]|uniref:hypothetical protein n=1 Tax=Streptomyces graminifolii TaxID=1266771 RepID=UPI00405A3F36